MGGGALGAWPKGTGSDLWGGVADEVADVAGVDDHGVDARALELADLLRRRQRQVGDRELARGDARQQVEHALERRVAVAAPRREQEDLRVDALQRLLELLLVAHVDDAVESELDRAAVRVLEAAVLVLER